MTRKISISVVIGTQELRLNRTEVTHLHFGSLEFEHGMVARADRCCPGACWQWSLDCRGRSGSDGNVIWIGRWRGRILTTLLCRTLLLGIHWLRASRSILF